VFKEENCTKLVLDLNILLKTPLDISQEEMGFKVLEFKLQVYYVSIKKLQHEKVSIHKSSVHNKMEHF
jgi:hypothetical protein